MADQEIKLKVSDDILKGAYANQMMVTHTREEFVMDYINYFPPEGIITARVIVSPLHMKRILTTLQENISKYEASFGVIEESAASQKEKPRFKVN